MKCVRCTIQPNSNTPHSHSSGTIPHPMGKWYPHITSLDLGHNRFTGTIPDNLFDSAKNLGRLSLRQNHFHGTIPSTVGQLTQLKGLFLNDNHFFGTIPKSLASGKLNLVQMFLQHNSFSGTIPQDLSEIRSLTDLFLDGNKLTGKCDYSMWHIFQCYYPMSHQHLFFYVRHRSNPVGVVWEAFEQCLLFQNPEFRSQRRMRSNIMSLEFTFTSRNLALRTLPQRILHTLPRLGRGMSPNLRKRRH